MMTVFAGVFFFEAVTENGTDYIFNNINKGKQWKDIKDTLVKIEEAEE